MKTIRFCAVILTIVSLLGAAGTARAGENAFRETFVSAFYGGAVGALVGGAMMVFTKKPADHFDYMGYGAAAGIIAGTAYGVAKSSRSLATIDNGSVRIALPTIIPDLTESPATRQMTVTWRADILRGTFN